MNPEDFQKLSEAVIRIDERTVGIDKKLDTFATKEAVAAQSDRIRKMENDATWARRGIITGLAGVVIAIFRPHIG